LSHRYQMEGVAKLIGGADYSYAVRGDGQRPIEVLSPDIQRTALTALLETLDSKFLVLPENLLQLIPPKAFAYERGRESFKVRTGLTFDPIAAAESSANMTLKLLLHHERAARLVEYSARNAVNPSFSEIIDKLVKTAFNGTSTGLEKEIDLMIQKLVVQHLIGLASNPKGAEQVRAIAQFKLFELEKTLNTKKNSGADDERAHVQYLLSKINYYKNNPKEVIPSPAVELPAGSPIGCGH